MATPGNLAASAFLVNPAHRPLAEGRERGLPLFALLPSLGAALLAGLGGTWAWERRGSAPEALLALVPLSAAAWLGWRTAMPALKALRLARQGRLVPGEVVYCSGTRSEDGSLVVNMKYRFKTPDGRTLESVERFAGRDLPSGTLPVPRTSLVVYYASDDCYRVL